MASVWLACDDVLERRVAVKVLSDSIASDPEFLARFRREAKVAASLWHPNLIGVYDYAGEAERPYLVLEYVPGPNLAERTSGDARIDCERLARELLGAVAHIHGAGIVHRDIKPQNILIAPDGSAKLIDFGIALPADATSLTRTGQLIGTARYLSPEVMGGAAASERSDLYSCGVVLRDCLGESSSPELRALVDRLASAEPSRRPRSAQAALARLDRPRSIPEEPTERLRPVPSPPALEGAGRQRSWGKPFLAVGTLAAIVVALLLVLGGGDEGGRGSKVAGSGKGETTALAAAARNGQASSDDEAEAAAQSEDQAGEEAASSTSPAVAAAGEDPETGAALNQEGFAMIQEGRYEEAVPVLEEAVALFPEGSEELDYAYALFNLGNALRLSGRPDEAIPVLEQRLAIPNQTGAVREELAAAESEAAGQ
jgi:hypothetical protein